MNSFDILNFIPGYSGRFLHVLGLKVYSESITASFVN